MGPADNLTPMFGVPIPTPNTPIMPVQNRTMVQPISALPNSGQSHTFKETSGKHTGIAGVARNVLGTLGDFLLKNIGLDPMYAPAQERRRLNEARQGYAEDPVAAIDRITSINFKEGTRLANEYADNARQDAANAVTAQDRAAALAKADAAEQAKARSISLNMLNTVFDKDEAKRPATYDAVKALIKKQNPSLELPDTYDETTLKAIAGGEVPVKDQIRIENQDDQAEERIQTTQRGQDIRDKRAAIGQDIQERRAAAAANRPRPEKRPTEGDIVSGLIDQQASGKPLSAGQKARVKKYTDGTRASNPLPALKNKYGLK